MVEPNRGEGQQAASSFQLVTSSEPGSGAESWERAQLGLVVPQAVRDRSSPCRCRICTKWEESFLDSLLLPEAQRKPAGKGIWEMWLEWIGLHIHRVDWGMAVAKRPREITGINPPHIVDLLTFAFD